MKKCVQLCAAALCLCAALPVLPVRAEASAFPTSSEALTLPVRHAFFADERSAYSAAIAAKPSELPEEIAALSYDEQAAYRQTLPVQSNEIKNWPAGPLLGCEAAILMEADTGAVLYAKNIHEQLYPASTTKLLTCLIAAENGRDIRATVPFSYDAVFSVPSDGSKMGIDPGEALTLEQCLYGIMVGSANEVANAVAEYTAGDMEAFAEMMNEKAASLGCTDSHFVNANGLFDEAHYTSAYDLALIARAFFKNELLCRIANTPRYHFTPTETQPDDFYLVNKHKLVNGEISFSGVVGGKTGYTSQARETLVTCAERDGMRLICVVLKEESPAQFTDTVALFTYGFQNFRMETPAETETRYALPEADFFKSERDIFGSMGELLSIDPKAKILLPNTIDLKDADAALAYENADESHAADIIYSYHDVFLGSAALTYTLSGTVPLQNAAVFINVPFFLLNALCAAGIVTLLALLWEAFHSYSFIRLRNVWKGRLSGKRRGKR